MKILFLAANPRDTDQLRLGEEVRAIDERLRLAHYRDQFELIQHWAIRPHDLSEYLLRHNPDIVHFSGHGSESGQIILEDQLGNAKPIAPQALGRMFRALKDNVRCVVLNACFSAVQAEALAQEIECVVGMTREIGDTAAIQFASGFYQALGYGRSFQTAFDNGCSQIDLDGLGEEATPKMLLKATASNMPLVVQGQKPSRPKDVRATHIITISGQHIKIATGKKTQSVNVFDESNREGYYQQVYRIMDPSNFVTAELLARTAQTLEHLDALLIQRGARREGPRQLR